MKTLREVFENFMLRLGFVPYAMYESVLHEMIEGHGESDSLTCLDQDETSPDGPEDEFVCSVTASQILPDGWTWHDWDDGSGSLRSPDNDFLFSYDLRPYHSQGGIEYRDPACNHEWSVFWGTLSEFKKNAEQNMLKMLSA